LVIVIPGLSFEVTRDKFDRPEENKVLAGLPIV
jgi:hypothetical protein